MPDSAPRWRQIAEAVAEDVRSGRYQVGDRIPAAEDQTVRFDADRNTIRKAYGWLRDLGVLMTREGVGTFVASVPAGVLPPGLTMGGVERRIDARLTRLEERITRLEERGGDRP